MFKNIIITIGTRVLSAASSFLIIILISNLMGAAALGNVGLIVLGITIVLLISNIIGGGALIYLAPRLSLLSLLITSYIWSLLASVLTTFILFYFKLIPLEYPFHIFILSLINSFSSVNLNLLLGREKIYKFNLITLLQVIMQLLFLWIMLLFVGQRHIDIYIYSLYVSYSVAFIFSFIYLVKEIKDFRIENLLKTAGSIIRYGGFVQLSNILQLLNYRLAYYIIDFYQGKVLLGIFTLGVQLSEGLWLLSKSAATVQYSKISNTKDKLYIKNFTNKLVKITFFFTLLLLIPLLFLPEAFFISVFGREFGDARFVLLYMSPGILAVAVNSMFSHYFSGTGRHHYNTIGSAIGLVITLGAGLILIPRYALTGAAFTASVSYFCSFIFQVLVYKNITKSGLIDFMPVKSDLYYIIGKIKSFFGK